MNFEKIPDDVLKKCVEALVRNMDECPADDQEEYEKLRVDLVEYRSEIQRRAMLGIMVMGDHVEPFTWSLFHRGKLHQLGKLEGNHLTPTLIGWMTTNEVVDGDSVYLFTNTFLWSEFQDIRFQRNDAGRIKGIRCKEISHIGDPADEDYEVDVFWDLEKERV